MSELWRAELVAPSLQTHGVAYKARASDQRHHGRDAMAIYVRIGIAVAGMGQRGKGGEG